MLNRSIIKIFIGLYLISMPSVMKFLMPLENAGSNYETISSHLIKMIDSISSISSILGYILFFLGIISIFIQKESSEDELTVQKKKEEISQKTKVSLEKLPKMEYCAYLDFKNKILNMNVKNIQNKIEEIKKNKFLEKDLEVKFTLDKIENTYLPTIFDNYKNIPEYLINTNQDFPNSAYNLTKNQLEELQNQLKSIEEKLLEDSMYNIKVYSRLMENKSQTKIYNIGK